MPAGFPCPNPTCTHVFPTEAIKGTPSLKCPRCGTTFNFWSQGPATPARTAPAAAPPRAKAVPPPPPRPAPRPPAARPSVPQLAAAVPVPPAVPVAPLATPVQPPTAVPPARDAALVFSSQPDLTVAPPALLGKRRPPNRWRLPLILGAALLGAGGLLTLVLFIVNNLGNDGAGGSTGSASKYPKDNFSFQQSGPPWKEDRELRARLGCSLAFSRKDTDNKMAIAVLDYEKRPPRPAVLLDETLDRLTKYFGGDRPAWEPKAPATLEKFEPQEKLADKPALVIEFQGTRDSVLHAGECWIMQYRGRAYLFFTLAPLKGQEVSDEVRQQWDALHKGFGLLDDRKGYTPQPRPAEPYRGDGYALSFANEVWTSMDREGDDKKAVLLLEGHDPKEEREGDASKAGKAAFLRVVVLDKATDLKAAAAAARKHFIARQVEADADVKPTDVQFSPADDKVGKADRPANIGAFKGHLSENHMTIKGSTLNRFLVIAVVALDDKVVAVYADCDWKRRDYWQQEFNALLATFRKAR